MTSHAKTPEEYLKELPADRKEPVAKLREVILKNLPNGFKETMSYGMLGYVVPHENYPAGYHCDPKLPLPFVNIASQKNFIAFYHMGFMPCPICWNGSQKNIQNKVLQNWIWVRAAYVLKSRSTFLTN